MHKIHDLCKGRRCFAWFRQESSCRHPQGLHGVPRSLSSMAKGLSRKTEKAMSRNHPLLLFHFFTFLLIRVPFTFLPFYFFTLQISLFVFLPFYFFTSKSPFYLFTFLLFTLQISLFTFLPFYFFTSKSPFYLFTFLLFYFSKKQGFFASQTRLLLNANKASFQCKEALFENDIKSY